jgi:heat shock protein HtpX
MNLYAQKDSNIRKTWLIFTMFLLVVMGFGWALSYVYNDSGILVIAVIFSIGMSFVSYWYSDKIVLKMSNAEPVSHENAKELYHIVENLAITAGIPTPKIYIIREQAPNAFATGRNPKNAVVAVTTGLLDKLDRSELEGVLAHELSHIGNYDMLISTMVVVLVGFISIASNIFIRSRMFGGGGGRRDNRDGGINAILMIIGLLFLILSPIVAMLMQLAISRKREFLADASGALLTRYPEGLAKALIKISSDPTPLSVANNTTAHLWLEDPFKKEQKMNWMNKLFLTHPPIPERVAALRGMKI